MLEKCIDIKCYEDGVERLWASFILLDIAYDLITKVPALQNLDKIKELAQHPIKELAQHPAALPVQQLHSIYLLTDAILDAFCIVASFEHALKGLLVRQGIAIHEIGNNNEAKILHKKQKNEPVTVAEVLTLEDQIYPQPVAQPRTKINILTKKTLNLSLILKKTSYITVLGLDQTIIDALLPIVDRRNKLTHLFTLFFGYPILKAVMEYEMLKDYIFQQVVPVRDELAKQIWAPRKE